MAGVRSSTYRTHFPPSPFGDPKLARRWTHPCQCKRVFMDEAESENRSRSRRSDQVRTSRNSEATIRSLPDEVTHTHKEDGPEGRFPDPWLKALAGKIRNHGSYCCDDGRGSSGNNCRARVKHMTDSRRSPLGCRVDFREGPAITPRHGSIFLGSLWRAG